MQDLDHQPQFAPAQLRIRLDRLCFRVKCDTVRTLLMVKQELGSLLPVAPAVEMPEVVTQKPMPDNFDFGADLFEASTGRMKTRSRASMLAKASWLG
eukprot:s2851_g3.t1